MKKTKQPELLFSDIRKWILFARWAVVRSVDALQVVTSFEIGRRIVEHEQKGLERAGYGKQVLEVLSRQLTDEFGKGFSRSNLEYMRKFFLTYRDRISEKSQMPSGISRSGKDAEAVTPPLSEPASVLSASAQASFEKVRRLFRLSWSQYVFLMGVSDAKERLFYEIEAVQGKLDAS